jgi:biopolymer transport protein ExbD
MAVLLGAWACAPPPEAPTVIVPKAPPSLASAPASPELKAPKTSRPPTVVKGVLEVELRADGELVLGGVRVASDADFQARVRKAVERSPDLRAELRVDGSVAYKHVIHALDLLRGAGVENVAFAVAPAGP